MTSKKSGSSLGNSIAKWLFLAAFAWLVAVIVSSCIHTTAPELVEAAVASYDGNEQNSGVIASTPSGFIVTDNFRLRYNALIATYGADLPTPATVDSGIAPIGPDRWLITKQRMIDFLTMNQWRRAGLKPLYEHPQN